MNDLSPELLRKCTTESEKETALFFHSLGLSCLDLSFKIYDEFQKATGEIDGIFLDKENEIIIIYDDSEQKGDVNTKITKFFSKWKNQENESKIFDGIPSIPYYPIYILYIDKTNSKLDSNTKSIEYLFTEKTHIIYKDDFQYFKQLSDRLGCWAKNDLYNYIEIKPTQLRVEIDALQIYIGDTPAYVYADRIDRILKYSYVSRRRNNDEGYQRMVDFKRIAAIKTALETGKLKGFPNSILLNSTVKFNNVPATRSHCPQIVKLTIPNHFSAFRIVDGQHRLLSFSQLDMVIQTRFNLPIVLLDNMPDDEEIKMFLDINDSPKSVDPSLRYELTYKLDWEANTTEQLQKNAVSIIKKLEKRVPMKGHIYKGTVGDQKKDSITLKAFVDSLITHNLINHEGGILQINGKDLDTPVKLLQQFLTEISKDGRNKDYFLSNRGIELVCNYLGSFLASNLDVEKSELIAQYSDLFINAVDENIEELKKYQGEKGFKDAFDIIINAIQVNNPDGNNITDCKKSHVETDEIIKDLPVNQGGSGRHKCASCAYEEGYKDGLAKKRKRDMEVINKLISFSQKGKRRHKDTTSAYELGYENGKKNRVDA